MKRSILAASLLSTACLRGFNFPEPITAPNRMPPIKTNQICLVQVHVIPEVTGHGYTWLQAGTQGTCGNGPKWSIEPSGAGIVEYDHEQAIAYVGGQEGIYRVHAAYDNGSGQVDISIEH